MAGWLNWKESPGKKKSCRAAEFAPGSRGRPAVARHSSYLQVSALRSDVLEEQRQYEHIKESAEKSGRYGNRAKEVAARTVMKEHKKKGHAKGT